MPFKTTLEAAIAHLVSKGRIKGAADVARDLDLKSRGTVSAYASGKTKISSNFQTMFENKYGIKLKDFEELVGEKDNNVGEPTALYFEQGSFTKSTQIKNPTPSEQDLKDVLIDTLRKQVSLLENQVNQQEYLQEKVEALKQRLVSLADNQLAYEARSQAYQEIVIQTLAEIQGKKTSGKDIQKLINQKAYEKLLSLKESGIEIQG